MPSPSRRISRINDNFMEGWEAYVEAVRRIRAGDDILMLSIGDHDFDTPQETVEACKRALEGGHHHYCDIEGIPILREAMAAISSEMTGHPTDPSQVIATPGGQAALYTAMRATLNEGDHAIVVGPYYVTYPGTMRAGTDEFTIVDAKSEDGFQPRQAPIEAAIRPNTKAILICTPNNPTGAAYSRDTMEMLRDVCIKHDLWLISDEVYWSLAEGRHISPRSLPDMAERTLTINSMSKSHGMTGWRIGWLTAPAHIINCAIQLNLVTTYGLPEFTSVAAAEALSKRYGVDWIRSTYASRREVMLAQLQKIPEIRIPGDPVGMYITVDIRQIEPDGRKFAMHLLNTQNMGVMPGESFGEATAGHLRLALTQPEDKLLEAAKRLKLAISDYADQSLAATS